MYEETGKTIAEVFGEDHRRLKEIWNRCREMIRSCSPDSGVSNPNSIRSNFEAFDAGLRRHIKIEEEILFPAFENATGMFSGPTAVMRAEHREIEQLLERVAKLIALKDCATLAQLFAAQSADPSELFETHDAKEESILYPMADHVIDSAQIGQVLAAMK